MKWLLRKRKKAEFVLGGNPILSICFAIFDRFIPTLVLFQPKFYSMWQDVMVNVKMGRAWRKRPAFQQDL